MQSETLEHKGYKIEVRQDECAENPWELWDCEPPLITVKGYRGGTNFYGGAPENWCELVELLPASCFERGNRVSLFKDLLADKMSIRELASKHFCFEDLKAAFVESLSDEYGPSPQGWSQAREWMEAAATLLCHGGIVSHETQSNGYSQGDSTLLLLIATPEWLEKTGVAPEHVKTSLAASAELFGAWAWGDVYGVSAIRAPGTLDEDGDESEGQKIEDGACWGFYGRDHEKSGLIDHAKGEIDYHLEQTAQIALNEPACLI